MGTSVSPWVAAERDEALTMVSATTKEFHAGAAQLAAEREDFERHRVKQEADLEAGAYARPLFGST